MFDIPTGPTVNLIPTRVHRGLGLADGDRVVTVRTSTGDQYVFTGIDTGQMGLAADMVRLATDERIVETTSAPMGLWTGCGEPGCC